MKVAIIGILLIRIRLQVISVTVAVASAVFPLAPPRFVPPTLVQSFEHLQRDGNVEGTTAKMTTDILSFLFSYKFVNRAVIQAIFLTAIACLF